jgi:hypothetical protein
MLEWLSRQSAEELIPVIAIVGGCLVALVSSAMYYWNKARQSDLALRQAELEAQLKQSMIERGMSADEIQRVLAAKIAPTKPGSRC